MRSPVSAHSNFQSPALWWPRFLSKAVGSNAFERRDQCSLVSYRLLPTEQPRGVDHAIPGLHGDHLVQAHIVGSSNPLVEDGPHLREELIRRLNRDWDAHRFDAVVAVVAGRLGFLGVDAAKLRARHLESWRKVVAVADDAGISSLLERRIEKDLLDLMNDALPASALDYLGVVPAWQPADLGALMLAIRASRGDGLSAVDILTRALATLPDGGTEARGQIER